MAAISEDFSDKTYRDSFVEETVKTGIAFQVRALRDRKKWTQRALGSRAKKQQNVISRLENPDYGKYNIRTLLDLASAFDVALIVKFVSFGRLMRELDDVSPSALAVPSFDEEMQGNRDRAERFPSTAQAILAGQPPSGANAKAPNAARSMLGNLPFQQQTSTGVGLELTFMPYAATSGGLGSISKHRHAAL